MHFLITPHQLPVRVVLAAHAPVAHAGLTSSRRLSATRTCPARRLLGPSTGSRPGANGPPLPTRRTSRAPSARRGVRVCLPAYERRAVPPPPSSPDQIHRCQRVEHDEEASQTLSGAGLFPRPDHVTDAVQVCAGGFEERKRRERREHNGQRAIRDHETGKESAPAMCPRPSSHLLSRLSYIERLEVDPDPMRVHVVHDEEGIYVVLRPLGQVFVAEDAHRRQFRPRPPSDVGQRVQQGVQVRPQVVFPNYIRIFLWVLDTHRFADIEPELASRWK
ncbi:hypothetical protein C8Q80DRAFT_176129 [Daedaleopsis nitida]|nr:hypothetical protein C8Q80DRAFT_176129 [Daedaleopsis nitida]